VARAQQSVLTDTVTALAGIGVAITAACSLLGLARSTFYRISRGYRHYVRVEHPVPHRDRGQPAALTTAERDQVHAILATDAYADLSVVQAYWRAFDTGTIACSQRSFYRIAGHAGLVGDRRRVRRPGAGARARRIPVATAARVGDLWSWDITELRGPRNQRYKLYLVIDVFSRYPVGWRIEHSEDRHLSTTMFATAIAEHGAPQVVHADNGAVMRSHELIDTLTAAGVLTSYSRPRVSDDNPFSESLFKTIKYDLDRPDRFDDIDHARTWTAGFIHRYTTEHRHSGLGRHTPATVFHDTTAIVEQQRQATLDRYWTAHPERFRHRPTPPKPPQPTGINTHLSQAG